MKVNRVVLIFILVVIIFVAVIFLFAYKTITPGKNIHYGTDNPQTVAPASTTPNQNDQTPSVPNTDNHTALDDCIQLQADEARGKEYVQGSLVVSFFNTLQYETALESMRLLDLKPDTSIEAKDNFDLHHWLTVEVPKGEEFKWQCILDASEGVKKANLNITFRLRQ